MAPWFVTFRTGQRTQPSESEQKRDYTDNRVRNRKVLLIIQEDLEACFFFRKRPLILLDQCMLNSITLSQHELSIREIYF